MVLPGAKADAFRRAAIHAPFLMEREPRKTGVLRLRPAPVRRPCLLATGVLAAPICPTFSSSSCGAVSREIDTRRRALMPPVCAWI